jgi:hypothetical protein
MAARRSVQTRRSKIRIKLRGRAGPAISCQAAHQGRRTADRGQLRQVAGFSAPPDKLGNPLVLAKKLRFCVSLGKTEEPTMQISECEQQARQCRKMAAEMNDSTHKKQMEVMAEIWETLVLELSKLNR